MPANLATDTVRRIAAEGVYCDAPMAKAARGVNLKNYQHQRHVEKKILTTSKREFTFTKSC